MTKAAYQKMTQPFRDHPKLAQSLHIGNQILTTVIFFAYPALLVKLFLTNSETLVPSIAVPAAGFLFVSALRKICSRTRPYERFQAPPVIPKDTRGESFPSRHVFSAAIIAATFFVQGLTVTAAVFFLFTVLLGAIRVVSGVHYISDVLAALVCAGIGWASYGIWL